MQQTRQHMSKKRVSMPPTSKLDHSTKTCQLTTIRDLSWRHVHFLGEVAQVSEIQEAILVNVDSLHKDDPVWVKRSDKSWTYAVVKDRENGPVTSIVLVVSSQGDTKKLTTNQCAKYLRKVADDDNDDDSQKELDKLMTLSIPGSHSSCKKSDEVSVDNSASMRTVLHAKEMYYSNKDNATGKDMRRHGDFAQTRSVELDYVYSIEPNGGKMQDRSLIGAIDGFCQIKGEEYRSKSPVNTSKWPESPVLKPSIQKYRSSLDIEQSKRHVSFRLNDEPKLQRQRSWSMEVEKIADELLKIPTKKLNDLNMEEILPQARRTMVDTSFHHSPASKHSRSSKLSVSLLQQDKCVTKEKPPSKKLNVRENTPQSRGQAGFESFHHALQSIHHT